MELMTMISGSEFLNSNKFLNNLKTITNKLVMKKAFCLCDLMLQKQIMY